MSVGWGSLIWGLFNGLFWAGSWVLRGLIWLEGESRNLGIIEGLELIFEQRVHVAGLDRGNREGGREKGEDNRGGVRRDVPFIHLFYRSSQYTCRVLKVNIFVLSTINHTKNLSIMKAIFKTRSNYRNLNGVELKVVEILGTRVTALIPDPDHFYLLADFTLSEVVKFTEGIKSMPDTVMYPKAAIK